MKLYTASEIHTEDGNVLYDKKIIALETKQEEEAYRNELFESLTAPFGWSDEDIYYYAMPGEKIEDIEAGAAGIRLEAEFQFEKDEPIVKLDDGFAVDLGMTVYLPSDGFNEAMSQPLYAQSEKSAKNLAEGLVCGILEESELQVTDITAKAARTFQWKQPSGKKEADRTPEELEAEYIKDHNLDITEILEHLGYFQHILMGKENVKNRAEILYECEDLDVPEGIDKDLFYERIAKHVVKNCNFDVLNTKTESMNDADIDIVDSAILDSAPIVEKELRQEKAGLGTNLDKERKSTKKSNAGR